MNTIMPGSNELIEKVQYNIEPIRNGKKDKDGKPEYIFNEILSDFGDTATTPEALDILRNEGKTFNLFKKMFLFAVSEMQIKNKPSSVNLYLMDLANPDLVDEMKKREKHFTFNPSQICLEVLECNYGKLDNNAIKNLTILKKRGYKFAIDDFSLDFDPDDISFDNLTTLLTYNLVPDYVKIDGKFLAKIFNNELNKDSIRELRVIIKFLKSKNIKIIGEWIGNTDEGYIAKSLGIELFQGKFLNDDFELKEEKVRSFKLTNDIDSFKLYMNAKAEEAEKLFNKMDNYTPLKKHEDISLSVQILAAMKHSNSNVERVLLPA